MLRSIEHRIESLVTGIFGRAFRSHVQPVELARKLAREMDENRTVSLSRVYAPNEYHLYLSPRDREQFVGYEDGLLLELADFLAEHARREGYALVTSPRVLLHEDADLSLGEFGISTRMVQPPAGQAPGPTPGPPAPAPGPVAPPSVLPVSNDAPSSNDGGTRAQPTPDVFPAPPPAAVPAAPPRGTLVVAGEPYALGERALVIGRAQECDITLDDPSVSRRHAEVRIEGDGFAIADLGSTNGTQLNGQRVQTARLAPGDRISIGQTELRFEQ